jgi:hypothetical protein
MDIGTNNFTIIWAGKKSAITDATQETIFVTDPSNLSGYELGWENAAFPRIFIDIYASQWVSVSCIWNTATTNGIPGDNTNHLYQIVGTRNATATLSIDGVDQGGTCSLTDISGLPLTALGAYLGSVAAGAHSYNGTLQFYEQLNALPGPTATPTNTPTPTPTPTVTPTPSGGCGASESLTGAAAAWCFNETSGNITDAVGSIVLTASGSPTYSVSPTQSTPIQVSGYNPGITIPASAGFVNASSQSAVAIGTSDFNFFWVASKDTLSGTNYVYASDPTNDINGIEIYWYSTNRIGLEMNPGFNQSVCNWTMTGIPNDGKYHSYEIRGYRTANVHLYLDGTEVGTGCDISSTSAQSIPAPNVYIGRGASTSNYRGTILFLRVKKSAT